MKMKKWLAKDCWVNEIKQDEIEEELKEYHPKFQRGNRSPDSYNMDLISKDIEDEYYILVTTDGSNGTGWKGETQKLLENTSLRVEPHSPDRLLSDPNIDLSMVVGMSFGKWKYVTIKVDLEIKTDSETNKKYREYTTTMEWSEKGNTISESSLGKTTTSYKWRD